MRISIDPKLVQLASRFENARNQYEKHIAQFAHPRQWNELSPQMQKDWYNEHLS